MRVDVRDEASVAPAVDAALSRSAASSFAANCAGAGGDMAQLERADQGVWDDVMAVNARGVWLSMRHEIRAMLGTAAAPSSTSSSIYGIAGKAAHHAYVASKHAVVGMSRSVALEHATRGVRVNAVCAGVTGDPGMRQAEAVVPESCASSSREHPMERMASEEEIRRAPYSGSARRARGT